MSLLNAVTQAMPMLIAAMNKGNCFIHWIYFALIAAFLVFSIVVALFFKDINQWIALAVFSVYMVAVIVCAILSAWDLACLIFFIMALMLGGVAVMYWFFVLKLEQSESALKANVKREQHKQQRLLEQEQRGQSAEAEVVAASDADRAVKPVKPAKAPKPPKAPKPAKAQQKQVMMARATQAQSPYAIQKTQSPYAIPSKNNQAAPQYGRTAPAGGMTQMQKQKLEAQQARLAAQKKQEDDEVLRRQRAESAAAAAAAREAARKKEQQRLMEAEAEKARERDELAKRLAEAEELARIEYEKQFEEEQKLIASGEMPSEEKNKVDKVDNAENVETEKKTVRKTAPKTTKTTKTTKTEPQE